jgi:hypothetical protein
MLKPSGAIPYTIVQVRERLPDVEVFNTSTKTFHTGVVRGRLNAFASVHFDGKSVQWSWEAIARYVNEGRVLRYSPEEEY